MLLNSKTITTSINKPLVEVYEFLVHPENFPKWAGGLATGLRFENGEWLGTGPGGDMRIKFTERNDFGVADHTVYLAIGFVVHVPLRVVANGDGSEVMLTLHQMPGMSADEFINDQKAVEEDLETLKKILEG